jgi:hypothetical protein
MAEPRPAPGPGEITVAAPLGRPLCTALDHRQARRTAQVVVTFGAPASHNRHALFAACWGRSYPLCAQCWHDTRHTAQAHQPGLVIHDTTTP